MRGVLVYAPRRLGEPHLFHAATEGFERGPARRRADPLRAKLADGHVGPSAVLAGAIIIALAITGAVALAAHGTTASASEARCAPIRWVFNPTDAPDHGLRDVQDALRRASAATGLTFVYGGKTAEVPSVHRLATSDNGEARPLLITWARAAGLTWSGRAAGRGSGTWRRSADGRTFVSGWIFLKTGVPLEPGFGDGRTWGRAILHELGHVLGLKHSHNRTDAMFRTVVAGRSTYSAAEVTRLNELGAATGCARRAA